MPKVKLPRKSTNIDMTAMCDVAFLLLTFFMLSTKFKAPEAVKVEIPSSVSSDTIPTKEAFLVSFDDKGRVFYSYDDTLTNYKTIEALAQQTNMQLTKEQKLRFAEYALQGIGTPIAQIPSLLNLNREEFKEFAKKQTGIPVPLKDTLDQRNELRIWIDAFLIARDRQKPRNLMLKGDNKANYPTFHGIIDAFTKNRLFNFKLITMPENPPEGSEMYFNALKEKKDKKK